MSEALGIDKIENLTDLIKEDLKDPCCAFLEPMQSSIDMYNNDVGKKSAQKVMKQTGDLKAATLYFAS